MEFLRFFCAQFLQVTTKPILVYPNSGESYDADKKEWVVSPLFVGCMFPSVSCPLNPEINNDLFGTVVIFKVNVMNSIPEICHHGCINFIF